MEGKNHYKIKKLIGDLLKKEGYNVEVEHRIGRAVYDIVLFYNDKKIFIEVYTYPPRIHLEPANITCYKCNYKWYTRSKKKWVSCPNCMSKITTKKTRLTPEDRVKKFMGLEADSSG